MAKSSSRQNPPQSRFVLVFHSQVTLCMSYIKRCAFHLKAIKHCKNASNTYFFAASGPSTNHPLKHMFHHFFSPGHKNLRKLHKHLGKVPKTSCTCHFSCTFLSSPPSHPSRWGECLIYFSLLATNILENSTSI